MTSFAQDLPNYRHIFETDLRWQKKESDHYIFHFFPDSLAAREIETISASQEKAFAHIISFLEVQPPTQKISYYFYPDEATKSQLMGDAWYAQSIYSEFRVHALYTDRIKPIGAHEDTHLLSLPWGLSIGLFQEGLAEYLAGHNWKGDDHTACAREGYSKGILPSIASLMDHDAWRATPDAQAIYFYSLAGAFVRNLVDRFGKEKFREVYQHTAREKTADENKRAFVEVCGMPVEEAARTIFL